MKIELLPVLVNAICTTWYLVKGDEPNKALYWLGATILAVGLWRMKG